jgi:hypothetical protein
MFGAHEADISDVVAKLGIRIAAFEPTICPLTDRRAE